VTPTDFNDNSANLCTSSIRWCLSTTRVDSNARNDVLSLPPLQGLRHDFLLSLPWVARRLRRDRPTQMRQAIRRRNCATPRSREADKCNSPQPPSRNPPEFGNGRSNGLGPWATRKRASRARCTALERPPILFGLVLRSLESAGETGHAPFLAGDQHSQCHSSEECGWTRFTSWGMGRESTLLDRPDAQAS